MTTPAEILATEPCFRTRCICGYETASTSDYPSGKWGDWEMAKHLLEMHLQRCPEMPKPDTSARGLQEIGWLSTLVGFMIRWTADGCRVFRTGNGGETWEEQS